MNMNTYEAIMTRRSTRNYKPDPVEYEKLQKIIEAGRFAPSGGNNQTNHFFVVTDKAVISKLAALAEKAFARMEISEDMYESLKKSISRSKAGGYVYSYNAPVLIIIANQKDYGNNIADCSVALENMMLEANELDLGSCWVNQLRWLNEDPELLDYLSDLGLKENERVYGAMILGYPDSTDGKPARNALERKGNEVTFIE